MINVSCICDLCILCAHPGEKNKRFYGRFNEIYALNTYFYNMKGMFL